MKVYVKCPTHQPSEDSDILGDVARNTTQLLIDKAKYKIMWELRSIEDEVNKEGGSIIVDLIDEKLELNGFSEDLSKQIRQLLD